MPKSDFRFSVPIRVRYNETDADAVVYYANYYIYMDVAVTEYLRHFISADQTGDANSSLDFRLVSNKSTHHGSARFDDQLQVFVRTTKIGKTSISYAGEIYRNADDHVLVSLEQVWVYFDSRTQKTANIPEFIVNEIREFDFNK